MNLPVTSQSQVHPNVTAMTQVSSRVYSEDCGESRNDKQQQKLTNSIFLRSCIGIKPVYLLKMKF